MDMALLGSSLGTVVLGMASTLLALALLVQVLQEMWKYLFTTRAGVYTRVLGDFLGPWARRLTEPGVLPDFQARGPFQLLRLKPEGGQLLPLGKADLVEGLERTAAPWHRRALRALRVEEGVQDGAPGRPTPEWERFMRELIETDPGGPGETERTDLVEFFGAVGSSVVGEGEVFDAKRTLATFRERFTPHVLDAERHFGRLGELFDYQYRRRNLVLTFAFGFGVALLLGFPIQTIHERAAAMSPEEASALAASVQELYQQVGPPPARDQAGQAAPPGDATGQPRTATPDSAALAARQAKLDSVMNRLLSLLSDQEHPPADTTLESMLAGIGELKRAGGEARFWYVAGCVLTAILVSFGAPFWNDLVSALAARTRPAAKREDTGAGG